MRRRDTDTTDDENHLSLIENWETMAAEVGGVHNPEHCTGQTGVVVGEWPNSPLESAVGLKLKYPNGTVSSTDMTPDEARAVADALVQAANKYEEAHDGA